MSLNREISELNGKGHEPSRAENCSARASSARTHHSSRKFVYLWKCKFSSATLFLESSTGAVSWIFIFPKKIVKWKHVKITNMILQRPQVLCRFVYRFFSFIFIGRNITPPIGQENLKIEIVGAVLACQLIQPKCGLNRLNRLGFDGYFVCESKQFPRFRFFFPIFVELK